MRRRSQYLFIISSLLFCFPEILGENRHIILQGQNIQEKINLIEDYHSKICYVRHINGDAIYPDQTDKYPYAVFDDIEKSCQVNINNITKENRLIGEWTLSAKINNSFINEMEVIRQPFVVLLREEKIETPKRLITKRNGPVEYEHFGITANTIHYCFLVRPNGTIYEIYPKSNITDEQIMTSPYKKCFFRIENVRENHLGDWKILVEVQMLFGSIYSYFQQPLSIELKETPNDTNKHIVMQGENVQEKIVIVKDYESKTCSLEHGKNTIYPNETEKYPKIFFNETFDACLVNIKNITRSENGQYNLIVKVLNEDKIETLEKPFLISLRDEDYRNVTRLITKRNGYVEYEFITGPSDEIYKCHLKHPNGTIYELYPETNVTDKQITTDQYKKCYFKIENVRENYLGEWKMLVEFQAFFEEIYVHAHQPLNIEIKEPIDPTPSKILEVYEEENIYISLSERMESMKNCSAESPAGKIFSYVNNNCVHVEKNVSQAVNGTWKINGTSNILLYTSIDVVVKPRPVEIIEVTLYYGSRATLVFGSEDSLYCSAINQNSKIEVENIGQCILQIDSVTAAYNGTWIVNYGVPESMTTLVLLYNVHVVNIGALGSGKLTAHYEIDENESNLNVSCKIFNTTIDIARLIRSDGKSFLIHNGIGYDRYNYFINHDSNNNITQYGMQIINPNKIDKDPWKCIFVYNDIKSESGSWIMTQPPSKNDQLLSPSKVNAVKNESFTLLCEYPRPISYCWFRSPNDTLFSLLQSTNNMDYEYFGSGFALGNCGIKIKLTQDSDHGKWTCNIGTSEDSIEKDTSINVQVQNSPLKSLKTIYTWHNNLKISCETLKTEPLEYCRYVKPDGKGISFTLSSQYNNSDTDLSKGKCVVNIKEYNSQDMGLWRCIAKPQTFDNEYTEEFHIYTNLYNHTPSTSTVVGWILFMCLVLFIVVILSFVVYKLGFVKNFKNRRITTQSNMPMYDLHSTAMAYNEKVKI